MGSALQGARTGAVAPHGAPGVSPRTEKQSGGRTSPGSLGGAVRCGSASSSLPARRGTPASIAERTLEEMGPAEVAAWLRNRALPANVEVDELASSLESRGVRGDQLADYTNRELRDVVGIKQLAWRKALLRTVQAERARERAAAALRALEPENDPSAMSLSGSFTFSFAAMKRQTAEQRKTQSFTVRKTSNQLAPLSDESDAPAPADDKGDASRMTWPLPRRSRPTRWRRSPSPSPDPAADGAPEPKARRSFFRRASPQPATAQVAAAVVEPHSPTAVAVAPAESTTGEPTLDHDTPREVEPEPEPRRRRLF